MQDDLETQRATIERQLAALQAQQAQRQARQQAPWPRRITLYASLSKEANYEQGEKIGLTGEALRLFVHFEEIAIEVEVAQDGHCTVVGCGGRPVHGERTP